MDTAAYDTTPLIRILDDNIDIGPHTPFSPERGHVVRPSVENPGNQLAAGNGIMDGQSIREAVVTCGFPTWRSDHRSDHGYSLIMPNQLWV